MTNTPARLWIRPPRWVPVVVGVASAIAVVLLWRELSRREHAELEARGHIAADAIARAVSRQFLAVQRVVERESRRAVDDIDTDTPGSFDPSVRLTMAETDGLERLLLIDSLGVTRRDLWADTVGRDPIPSSLRELAMALRPRATDASVRPVSSAAAPRTASSRTAAPRTAPSRDTTSPGTTLHIRSLTDGPWGIALLRPVNTRLEGPSTVVGLVDEHALLQAFTADTGAGFVVRAFVADSEVVGIPVSPDPPTYTREVVLGERVIRLTLTPNASNRPSALPTLVLALGLALAALLAVALWLARATYDAASAVGLARMQRAIERATDGVWELDLLSHRAYRSEALLRSLGLNPDNVNGSASAWNARVHRDDIGRIAEELAAHLSGATESFECEYRLQAANGHWHTIVDRGRVIERALDGRAKRMLGISADVTERSRAEAAREESERRFRAIFETAHHLQLLLDCEGRILEANAAAADRAETTPPSMQQHPFTQLAWWRPADVDLVAERVRRAADGQASHFEAELPDGSGQVSYVDFSLKPIRDEADQVIQVLAEGRDMTARKRAEASLREISALTTMGQLAARVAHDINNPLAGIQNAFLLVREAIPTDHPHHSFVGSIEREIARIAAVTRQLYETYRPDQATARTASVVLAVGDAVSFLEQVNRTRQVRIVTDVSRAPSIVPVPDALLRQALYNLVQNAFDVSPSGGGISVLAALEDGSCVIRVMDEGPGIPEALQQRIFDPFFTTKDRSVKTGGMGIGLSLVHQSVTAVGGSIEVKNRASGGSEFIVRLPMTPIDTGVLR